MLLCLLLLAELYPGRSPIAAEQYHSWTIKTQRFHCGTACWGKPNDVRPISTPDKMVRPGILLGVEQRDHMPGKRVVSHEACGFVTIARGTTQAQVVELGAASSTAWDDVIYLKCHPHHRLGTQAIGASTLRNINDSLAQYLRDTGHASSLEQA